MLVSQRTNPSMTMTKLECVSSEVYLVPERDCEGYIFQGRVREASEARGAEVRCRRYPQADGRAFLAV